MRRKKTMTAMTMRMKELCAKQISQASGGVKSALNQYGSSEHKMNAHEQGKR